MESEFKKNWLAKFSLWILWGNQRLLLARIFLKCKIIIELQVPFFASEHFVYFSEEVALDTWEVILLHNTQTAILCSTFDVYHTCVEYPES